MAPCFRRALTAMGFGSEVGAQLTDCMVPVHRSGVVRTDAGLEGSDL